MYTRVTPPGPLFPSKFKVALASGLEIEGTKVEIEKALKALGMTPPFAYHWSKTKGVYVLVQDMHVRYTANALVAAYADWVDTRLRKAKSLRELADLVKDGPVDHGDFMVLLRRLITHLDIYGDTEW